MSISALSSSSMASTFFGSLQNRSSRTGGESSDDIAASIINKDDADGDGLLSLSETPLDEERFSAIDSDGDGFISAEELSADAQSRQQNMNSLVSELAMRMQGMDPDEMAESIVAKDDADGDGVLSLDETPLDEDRFNSIDADGDGYISAAELSADAQENMEQGAPAAAAQGSETQSAAASASGSGGSESEEEYDEYDLNEDGVVSFDELLQAFNSGDNNVKNLLQSMGGGAVSSMTSRLASEAYQAQMG